MKNYIKRKIVFFIPMKKTVSLTQDGKQNLENELKSLIKMRPAIADRLATARSFGDLKENQE